jgi:hypothetical protein
LTKLDKVLSKSVITKEKASLTKGTITEASTSLPLQHSQGVVYPTGASITLVCHYGDSQQTFKETFYIVDGCHFDAMLRRDIKKGPLKDEPSSHPLLWKPKTQGSRPSQ